jgi:hypothetical protein
MKAGWSIVALLGLVVGCGSKGGASAGPDPATNEAAPTKAAAPGAKPTLAGHTGVPTLDEWSAVGEVTVKGSTALGCETKRVREWIRISCRGKNKTGGTATGVTVDRGDKNRGDVFKFVSGGVVSLVYPFVDGTDFEATFTWSDGRHRLVSRWPHGAPQPNVVGDFD